LETSSRPLSLRHCRSITAITLNKDS
jgi:hypothetical protein